MPDLLTIGPAGARVHLLLAHGAGAAMTSPFLEALASTLATDGLQVSRFNFAYMAARASGHRRPPPKAELLIPEFVEAVESVRSGPAHRQTLVIGGKSMGGRVASMAALDLHARGFVSAVAVAGYPFHPPGKPQQLRTAHLERLACPMLIVQGDRDPFGTREEVEGYALSKAIEITWIGGGDHDLTPVRGSGVRKADNITRAADAIARFSLRQRSEGECVRPSDDGHERPVRGRHT